MEARPEEKKEEPKKLTPEQQEAAVKKKKLQDSCRRYYIGRAYSDKLAKRPKLTRWSGAPDADEEAPPPTLATIVGNDERSLSDRLTPNSDWDIEYREEYATKKRRFKNWIFGTQNPTKKVGIHVDNEGKIVPGRPYPRTLTETRNYYTQIIRAYTTGMGKNRLTLDYPTKKDKPEDVKLNDILEVLKIAEKEGTTMGLGGVAMARLRLINPNNKKEVRMRNEILMRVSRLEQQLQKNTALNEAQAKAAKAYNLSDLDKNMTTLKNAGKTLEKAKTKEELATGIKQVEEAKDKTDKSIERIRADMDEYPYNGALENYSTAVKKAQTDVNEISKFLADARERVEKGTKATPEEEKERDKIKSGLEELSKKANEVAAKADVEKKLPSKRVEIKKADLIDKAKEFDKAVKALEAAKPEISTKDRIVLLTALQKAMDDLDRSIKAINAETKKKDVPEADFKIYKDEMTKIAYQIPNQLEKIKGQVDTAEKDTTDSEYQKAGKNVKTIQTALIDNLAQTTKNITDAPLKPGEREKARMESSLEAIKEAPDAERFEDIVEALEGIETDLREFDEIDNLKEELKREPSPERVQEITVESERLAEQKARLEEYTKQLGEIITAEMAKHEGKAPASPEVEKQAEVKKSAEKTAKKFGGIGGNLNDLSKQIEQANMHRGLGIST